MKVFVVLASFGMLVNAAPQLQHQHNPPGSHQTQQSQYQKSSYSQSQSQPQQQAQASYGVPSYSSPPNGYGPHGGDFGGPGGYSGAPPVVHKHVYVHVPPPEPHYVRPKRPYVPLPPPQKHYKIIFIKAPTPPPPEIPEINLPPPPETKTLVYVLVKKPEPAPPIKIPVQPPTKPSKPEVYFIRYKTPTKDAGYDGGYAGAVGSPAVEYAPAGDVGNSLGGEYGAPAQDYHQASY